MSETFGQLIPALVVFVGGPALIWWLRRTGRGPAGTGMRVTARTSLTRNSVIAVIETDGRRWLVGATDQGVSVLSELEAAAEQEALSTEEHAPQAQNGPRTSPLEKLRVLTTRRVTRPGPARVIRP